MFLDLTEMDSTDIWARRDDHFFKDMEIDSLLALEIPVMVKSGGEVINLHDKQFIENALKCHLVNIYAGTEFLSMGISKPEYGGMYLLEYDLKKITRW